MAWDNKTRPNKTAKIRYACKADADDPLVLVPDPDMVPLVEQAIMEAMRTGAFVYDISGAAR